MGRIVVSNNVTLDGVVQDPAGDESFRVGGWVGLLKDLWRLKKRAQRPSGRLCSGVRRGAARDRFRRGPVPRCARYRTSAVL
jgi:hypothetical protein